MIIVTVKLAFMSQMNSSPCKKDSVGIKKAAAIIPSMVMNFKNQNLSENEENKCVLVYSYEVT